MERSLGCSDGTRPLKRATSCSDVHGADDMEDDDNTPRKIQALSGELLMSMTGEHPYNREDVLSSTRSACRVTGAHPRLMSPVQRSGEDKDSPRQVFYHVQPEDMRLTGPHPTHGLMSIAGQSGLQTVQSPCNVMYQNGKNLPYRQSNGILPLLCPLSPPSAIFSRSVQSPSNTMMVPPSSPGNVVQSQLMRPFKCLGIQQQSDYPQGFPENSPLQSSPRGTDTVFKPDIDQVVVAGNSPISLPRSSAKENLRRYLAEQSSPTPLTQHTFGNASSSPGTEWNSGNTNMLCSPKQMSSPSYRMLQAQDNIAAAHVFSPSSSPRETVQQVHTQPLGMCAANVMDKQQLLAAQASRNHSPQSMVRSPVLLSPTPTRPVNISIGEPGLVPLSTIVDKMRSSSTIQHALNAQRDERSTCGVSFENCEPHFAKPRPYNTPVETLVSSSMKAKIDDECAKVIIDVDEDDEEPMNYKRKRLDQPLPNVIAADKVYPGRNVEGGTRQRHHSDGCSVQVPDSPSEQDIKQVVVKVDDEVKPSSQDNKIELIPQNDSPNNWGPVIKDSKSPDDSTCDKSSSVCVFPTPVLPAATVTTPHTTVSDTWKVRIGPSEKLPVLGVPRSSPTTITPANKVPSSSRLGPQTWTPDFVLPIQPGGGNNKSSKWSVVNSHEYTGTPHPTLTGRYVIPASASSVSSSKACITSPLYTSTPISQHMKQPDYPYMSTPSSSSISMSVMNLNSSGSEEASSPSESSVITESILRPPPPPRNTPIMPDETSYHAPTANQLQSALHPFKSNQKLTAGLIVHQPSQQSPELDLELGRSSHNLKERERRARIKSACEKMRDLVPGITHKTDKATVFEYTAQYISFLKGIVGAQYDTVWEETTK